MSKSSSVLKYHAYARELASTHKPSKNIHIGSIFNRDNKSYYINTISILLQDGLHSVILSITETDLSHVPTIKRSYKISLEEFINLVGINK